jgi:signal peptidase II
MKRPLSKWAVLSAVFVGGMLLDQWSKYLAVERLTELFRRIGAETLGQKIAAFYGARHLERFATEPYVVFAPLWRMVYVENPNAAFGLGHFLPPGPRRIVFLCAAVVAAGAIAWFYRKLEVGQRFHQLALALVAAGAIGNFVDRALRSYVIDFVDWHWWNRPDWRWPTFNVADSMLVVGVALLLLKPLPGEKKPEGT